VSYQDQEPLSETRFMRPTLGRFPGHGHSGGADSAGLCPESAVTPDLDDDYRDVLVARVGLYDSRAVRLPSAAA